MVIQRGSHLLTYSVPSLASRNGGSRLVLSISQLTAGECNLGTADPCTTISTHQAVVVDPVGAVNYSWTVSPMGGSSPQIVSGQGTDTVEVSDSGAADSVFRLTCSVTDDESSGRSSTLVIHDRVPAFDGGMFSNGGFEAGLTGWLEYTSWVASADAYTAENPATTINEILYQNFTLELGEAYRISALHVSGDAIINYLIDDGDSGISIADGAYIFLGDGTARSIGIVIAAVGTVKSVVDNLRLVHVPNPTVDFTATPDPLLIEYVPNAVTHEGEMVTYNGEVVTYDNN